MTHNQIRFVKTSLAVLLVGFMGLVSHQLYVSIGTKPAPLAAPIPEEPNDMLARQVELTRLDSEGEKEFVLRAAERVGGTEEVQTFRDVEIEFEANQGRLPVLVTADLCHYDTAHHAAHLEGNVVIQDEDSMRIETSALDYQRRQKRVWTDRTVRFWRDGLEGTAGNVQYHFPSESYELQNGVRVSFREQPEAPIEVESESAVIQRQRSYVRFIDDVMVRQGTQRLSCNDLQVFLTEDESQMEHFEAYHDVEVVFRSTGLETGTGDMSGSSGEGSEPVGEKGNRDSLVEEPGKKRLLTDNLEVLFREHGQNLERMRAFDGGKLIMESPPGADGEPAWLREIEANILIFDFDEQGRLIELSGRGKEVTLTLKPVQGAKKEEKRVVTRRFEAVFEPESGDLKEARCEDGVEFYQTDLRATAAEGLHEAKNGQMTLTGAPRMWDPRTILEARIIHIDVVSGDLEAAGEVRTTWKEDPATESLALFPGSKGGPVYFVSEHLFYKKEEDTATYTGGARGFQEDNRIEAERIVLYRGKGVLEATGSVRTLFFQPREGGEGTQQTVTRAGELSYRSQSETMTYRQEVIMQSDEITLRGSQIDVTLQPGGGSVAEILAEREVEIQTPEAQARGDHARYLPKSGEVRMTGDHARLQEGDKLTEGKELTFFLAGDKIFVGGRELSRTKTTYASQPRPF